MKVVKTVWQAKASSVPRDETVAALLIVLGESRAGRGNTRQQSNWPFVFAIGLLFPMCEDYIFFKTFKDFSDIKKKQVNNCFLNPTQRRALVPV